MNIECLVLSIEWNGFLQSAIDKYPKESCAFLFSKYPYTQRERWAIGEVKNASPDPENEWIPDKKDMHKVKKLARIAEYVCIGNVHSHPLPIDHSKITNEKVYELMVHDVSQPSEKDLLFARKFNNIVRGIIVVNELCLYKILFHDMFNNVIYGKYKPCIPQLDKRTTNQRIQDWFNRG